ncbi:helix-turn-helix domain-containing protein [Gemmatimonas sp.]|uniref:helix-turn-helix domain-containing protein n=1 Tax=Gemmatimonas sp. TaxID=1962908 RepID=UPI0025BB5377|nr:helix-turn-helix domain-containing protein [Gemmatimonas sp.]MCA2991692.1 helix-turn-helix domain-containing protein [Gemmatimonas sp.]
MARPEGSQEKLAERRLKARKMYAAGVSIPEIASRLQCTQTAVRKWLRDTASPHIAVEQWRTRVFARLQEERSAAVATGGRYSAWVTEALPYAFGEAFLNAFVDDETEDLTLEVFTNTLTDWNCYRDEHGVWRTPRAA